MEGRAGSKDELIQTNGPTNVRTYHPDDGDIIVSSIRSTSDRESQVMVVLLLSNFMHSKLIAGVLNDNMILSKYYYYLESTIVVADTPIPLPILNTA